MPAFDSTLLDADTKPIRPARVPLHEVVERIYALNGVDATAFLKHRLAKASGYYIDAVELTVQKRLQDIPVSFKGFGAVGGGVLDDSAAVLKALNSGARIIDGGGDVYRIGANIVTSAENIQIQNAIFDVTGVSTGGSSITFQGSQNAAVALSANFLKNTNVATVASTAGFAVGDYVWLSSNRMFDTAAAVKLGQVARIKAITSATQMTTYNDLLYDFLTADNASLAKLNLQKNITMHRVGLIGADEGNQSAVRFDKCLNVLFDDFSAEYFDYAHVILSRCVNVKMKASDLSHASAPGLAYGVAIGNGCYGVTVENSFGDDQRHFVTIGDNDGVNLYITVEGNKAINQRDAGVDSHPAGDFVSFLDNTVEVVDGVPDAIISQAPNSVIVANTTVGNASAGIRHQLLPEGVVGSSIIVSNKVGNTGGNPSTDSSIYVQNSGAGSVIDGVVITGNQVDGQPDYAMQVNAVAGHIKNVAIGGNAISGVSQLASLLLRADSGFVIDGFTIFGNTLPSAGVNNIFLLGDSGQSVRNGSIGVNAINGGTNGIRMIGVQNVTETGNTYSGVTRRVLTDADCREITLDRRAQGIVVITNAIYDVTDADECLVVDRAGLVTIKLPSALTWKGRTLFVKTIQAQAVVSDASNVAPINDATAGTGILPATDGAWALLKCDGTNWIVMQRGS